MINVVVDLSHYNSRVDFVTAKAKGGILGVIHKATQGASGHHAYLDSMYTSRKQEAKKAGLLWGAYHFGIGDVDGVSQANYFLEMASPTAQDLMALDYEENTVAGESTMTVDIAEAFVEQIHKKTGRWPILYTRTNFIRPRVANRPNSSLFNCPLWLASYFYASASATAQPPIPQGWPKWTLWQYTDGSKDFMAPSSVEGLSPCDRDKFNGTESELRAFWGQTS